MTGLIWEEVGDQPQSAEGGVMYYWILVMVVVLQWNAWSLLANGQEFKKFIVDMPAKPDVICMQDTWLKPDGNC